MEAASGNNMGKGKVELLGKCDPETYPIQKKALSNEYLRDHVHLRARTDTIASMIRLRNGLRKNIGAFFEKQGFIYADTPIITGNDAEGAGEAFEIAKIAREHPAWQADPSSSKDSQSIAPTDFFSRPAYLTVSHQLHLEALATALSRVYTLAPCFRAEPSLTGRHLAEFWMMEAEWVVNAAETQGGDGKQVADVCGFVEGCLRDVVGEFVVGKSSDMDVLWKDGNELKRRSLDEAFGSLTPWTRMSYSSAIRYLEEHNSSTTTSQKFKYEPKWGWPLQSEHERWIAEKLIGGPVFITDYPSAIKPFYMRVNDEGTTVACFDLIVPHVGELVGGSVREERAEILDEWANVGAETNAEEYKWYLDLRRYGGAPHVGFGMGFERLVSWVGGIDNIRECVPMPRWAGRMLL
ncbi:hypothetical protein BDZ94DRAFT_1265734 [Collybia nuda]|uniref:asparagine--tRNA ligase n=1 Tax=Collybia nuda TaxID=64659 RepID=A0A9P5XZA4_9AGAR|nr:hypothetical protein BDZ94DRAFT_1265734 [Collybia nuda]